MADLQRESQAFLAWLATFDLSRPVTSLSDLSDGAALFDVLSLIDAEYFRHSRPSAQQSDNWVLRFSSLKRLYRLINQYFAEVLHRPSSAIDVPDLQAVAKDGNVEQTLAICRLTIAIAVQSEKNKDVIERIQRLSQSDQHALMRAIEQVLAKFPIEEDKARISMTDDDHYYHLQTERGMMRAEKETLEKVYQALIEEHRSLQSNYDDAVSEKNDAIAQLREVRREVDGRRNEKADVLMRAEIDRLRTELQKSENDLGMAEMELDKNAKVVTELTKKVEDLQTKADQAVKLKDQVDEYRHAADKLQKTENVMEKYKKKLEESADLRRRVKALEDQNASLVDKNASLEEEYRKVSAFKPLMESYKSQIAELESKGSAKTKETDAVKFELDQTRTRLRILEEERAKDGEALELYQERVKELELTAPRVPRKVSGPQRTASEDESGVIQELVDGLDDEGMGLGGELDDALTGTTTTDLKLQIRKLKRDLEAAQANQNQAEASRVLVLENLLDDARRMKSRYEADYLSEHREKLVLTKELDEIRSGKSLGDGPEAAIALRQRLNETVEQLDKLRNEYTELEVKLEGQERVLTIAKSDLNLVNKDQLDILASLRESVNEDKVALEADLHKAKEQVKELKDKNSMQLEQVNKLLLERINLQTDGIGQREKMLERERDFGDLRASIAGKDLPEETKSRLLSIHEENIQLKELVRTTQEKLTKAKQFIKEQDKLFRDEQAKLGPTTNGTFGEAEETFRSQIKILEEEVSRYKRLSHEAEVRYRKEQELMLGAFHELGMSRARDHLSSQQQLRSPAVPAAPSSWLGQQRKNMGGALRR